jgi:hypothetical protein
MKYVTKMKTIKIALPTSMEQGSAVGIATGYGLDDQGVGAMSRIFISPCEIHIPVQ